MHACPRSRLNIIREGYIHPADALDWAGRYEHHRNKIAPFFVRLWLTRGRQVEYHISAPARPGHALCISQVSRHKQYTRSKLHVVCASMQGAGCHAEQVLALRPMPVPIALLGCMLDAAPKASRAVWHVFTLIPEAQHVLATPAAAAAASTVTCASGLSAGEACKRRGAAQAAQAAGAHATD